MKIEIEISTSDLAELARNEINLKEIPTEQLVAELSSRDGVQKFDCDLYKHNYRVRILDYTQACGCSEIPTPGHCDVLVIARNKR